MKNLTPCASGGFLTLILLAGSLFMAGCATPDLRPFSDSTGAMTAAARRAGDVTHEVLSGTTIKTSSSTFRPGNPNHPAAQFQTSWNLRRKVLDDIEAYAASLSALSAASANAKANVTQVMGSLKELAGNAPTLGPAFNAAGDLVVKIGQTAIEVKAHRDMSKLVAAAHPVVGEVVAVFVQEMDILEGLYETPMRDRLKELKDNAEKPRVHYQTLLDEQVKLRANATAAIIDDNPGRERILHVRDLIAAVEPEVAGWDRQIAAQTEALSNGLKFFKEAKKAFAAWLSAHEALQVALRENQTPNLTLIMLRAQELRAAAEHFRKPQTQ